MVDLDPEAFCARVLPRLVGSMSLYSGDRGEAEDIAQEALARAWERWDRVGSMTSPEGWVFMTARNLARRRHRIRRRDVESRLVLPDESNQIEAADRIAVRAAVSRLPDRQKSVLIARFFLGFNVAETADLLGCAEGTVKAATHQAVANLRASGLVSSHDQLEVNCE